MLTVKCSTPTCLNYGVEISIPADYNSLVFCGVCGSEIFPIQDDEDVEVPPWLT